VNAPLPGMPDLPDVQQPPQPLSPTQRRTRRQYAALQAGQHPLSVALGTPLPLHPDAAPADDPKAPGLRCGTCAWRASNQYGYGKCWFGDGARATHGAGTDVRRWWPACRDYEPAGGDR